MAAHHRVDDLQADCLYTGINSGPNARYRVWEAFTFLPFLDVPHPLNAFLWVQLHQLLA